MQEAKLYTDGGSRGNPGPSAAAFVICKMDDVVVEKTGKYLGIVTNNQAEYQALCTGLARAEEIGVDTLHVMMDSELIIKQMNGLYKVKSPDLLALHMRAKQLSTKFKSIDFTHILRAFNNQADAEVNRVLDSQSTL